jgi:hypothetical protein
VWFGSEIQKMLCGGLTRPDCLNELLTGNGSGSNVYSLAL